MNQSGAAAPRYPLVALDGSADRSDYGSGWLRLIQEDDELPTDLGLVVWDAEGRRTELVGGAAVVRSSVADPACLEILNWWLAGVPAEVGSLGRHPESAPQLVADVATARVRLNERGELPPLAYPARLLPILGYFLLSVAMVWVALFDPDAVFIVAVFALVNSFLFRRWTMQPVHWSNPAVPAEPDVVTEWGLWSVRLFLVTGAFGVVVLLVYLFS